MISLVSQTVEDVEVIKQLKRAAWIYIKRYFIIDFMSFFPSLIYWESNVKVYPIKIFRYLRLKRFFKFFDYFQEPILPYLKNE